MFTIVELCISVALVRFWGLFYLVFGGLFILAWQLGRAIEMTDDKVLVIATGYSTLLIGLCRSMWPIS